MLEQVNLTYEKVVLIGIINQLQTEEKSKEYLDELEFLTYTAGGEVLKRFTQKLDVPNPKTFIGTGKMEEVQQYVEENEVGTVIFDDELTPAQQKNIERILKAKILDRTGLILDIFAGRACAIRIPIATPYRSGDAPRTPTRGDRDARTG